MAQDFIRYSVSITPVEELTPESATPLAPVIASEVGTSLGGSGTVNVTNYGGTAVAQGYKDAAPNYLEATDTSDTAISTEATASCIVIINTGKTFSSATVLGVALDKSLEVMAGPNDKTVIGVLEPGGSMVLPCNTGANIPGTNVYVKCVEHDGTTHTDGHLAVERLIVD